MDNSTDVSYTDVYQPSWVSYYLMKEFPEMQNWNPELEELIITGTSDEQSETKSMHPFLIGTR